MTSFENVPKIKVDYNLIFYNFAFMTTAKFFLDFELQGQSPRLTQNPNFWEFIFETKILN